ncbi:ribonuclease D [Desulfonema magnum]|uniref:Exonuclease domain-containing protein, HRDC domain-containing n=1 Tax=Desulfonema magnum TaxID=45655 RepID=A0A975BWM2_9BACT|nr:ribonuclease D [Desulfonema magnum]QTA93081.1 Exonuclease domain-containing protein, HRDC domain-containing [Desulfonema magnum]
MKDNNKLAYQIINTESELRELATALEKEKTVAVDLEADSMYHFKEKVCLLQIAAKQANIIIDPLQINDLSPLKPIFFRHDIRKIFHGADYDVRSLYRDFNIEINNLFDTQIACRFLGIPETGLEAVLQKQFHISLDKKYQKKDWSQRPLPEDMMDYAAKDAVYLVPLAKLLEKRLEKKGRLSWVYEECHDLSKVRCASSDDDPLYLRFKGAGRLRPRNLAVLESLLQFRKQIAEKKDKPLFKIFGNNSLMRIATAKPVTLQHLERIKALSRKQTAMYGDIIVARVRKALKIPAKDLPVYPRKKGPVLSPKVPERVKAIKRWRDARAKKLDIDPALICNKALISVIAVQNPRNTEEIESIEEMKNWQQEAFGRDIVTVLRKVR